MAILGNHLVASPVVIQYREVFPL
ncbi:uncharacterized protein METZ01_LOCUS447671, partial [marine metagenome]